MKYLNSCFYLMTALGLATTSIHASTVIPIESKITALDAEALDVFGFSVAISGTTAIVGAYGNDAVLNNGSDLGDYDISPDIAPSLPLEQSGSAYLYDTRTRTQIAKLTPNDPGAGDRFGYSVAISGEIAVVGAYRNDDAGRNSGAAYLFNTVTGRQIAKLIADDAAIGDEFGHSVAISGTTAIVGSRFDDDNGINSGSAYLFDTATGNQITKLTADDGSRVDFFGHSVAISGNRALVGAFGDRDSGVPDSDSKGSAYLFDVSTGSQLAKLTANDATANDQFGRSVAISGSTALIGSKSDDGFGQSSGSAYVFDVETGAQVFKLKASDAEEGDLFGFFDLAFSGTTAIIGAEREGSSGAAYLFDTVSGNQISKLTAIDSVSGDAFGGSVAISGSSYIIGAYTDDAPLEQSGSAYIHASIPATVPLPASIWFLGAAIGFLMGRRKSSGSYMKFRDRSEQARLSAIKNEWADYRSSMQTPVWLQNSYFVCESTLSQFLRLIMHVMLFFVYYTQRLSLISAKTVTGYNLSER